VSTAAHAVDRAASVPKRRSYWGGVLRRIGRDPVTMLSAGVLLLIFAAAVFAPWIAPADPYKASMLRRLLPIGSEGFALGTDELGRDMISRLLYGVPHVMTVHSLEPLRPWKAEQLGGGYQISSWAERQAYETAAAVIAVRAGVLE